MYAQNSDPIHQIVHYEQQLKATSQKLSELILDNNPSNVNQIRQLIAQEDQLIKILEVESSKLNPYSRDIYAKNMTRYKRKAKEHKEYIAGEYGARALPGKSEQMRFIDQQNQNARLLQNKMDMYENQRIQEGMGRQLHEQGEKLYGGIEKNRQIRGEADTAQGSIQLIKLSILKRKFMFFSLIILFIIVLIFSIIMKVKKK